MRARIVVLADLICVLDRGRDEKTESQTKRLIEERGTERDREGQRGTREGQERDKRGMEIDRGREGDRG